MIALIARRLAQLPLILLVIYTITFVLAWALPGSAVIRDEGRRPPAAVLAAMEARYNLDSPARFYWQYLYHASGARWLVSTIKGDHDAIRGGGGMAERYVFDFGPSFRYDDWTVNELIASSLPVSVALGFGAILLALAIGLAAGVIGALRPNSVWDHLTLALALVGVSLPSFVIGTTLLMIFPVWLGIGRVASWGQAQDAILPAFTLCLPFAAYIARLTRLGMLDTLGADYIRTARAKGLPEHRVILRHALKNAFLPVLSYLGPACAFAMTGSFVVERVFSIPGIGRHFVGAVKNKDLFVIMGIALIYSAILILFNLVVDILYAWVDPRIEQS